MHQNRTNVSIPSKVLIFFSSTFSHLFDVTSPYEFKSTRSTHTSYLSQSPKGVFAVTNSVMWGHLNYWMWRNYIMWRNSAMWRNSVIWRHSAMWRNSVLWRHLNFVMWRNYIMWRNSVMYVAEGGAAQPSPFLLMLSCYLRTLQKVQFKFFVTKSVL